MTIQIIRRASLGLAAGTIRTLAPATEAALVLDGEAIYATAPNPGGDDLTVRLDPTSRQIVGADGAPIPAQVALSALVSEAGTITAAALLTTTGTLGQAVRLSDGPDKGAILMWSTPEGSSTPQWCWWLWPQASYL